jgi:6-phosphogluconolactonase/glucosamine-6-phosphate isomerase/deaminase
MNTKPPDLLSSSRFSIEVHATRESAGASAAARAAEILRCALRERGEARAIVASAPSQDELLADGCFPDMEFVPARAITLTCPALMRAAHAVCIVPGPRKAKAVRDALLGPVSEACPASILRAHPDAYVYLDTGSASGLGNLLRSC